MILPMEFGQMVGFVLIQSNNGCIPKRGKKKKATRFSISCGLFTVAIATRTLGARFFFNFNLIFVNQGL